MGLIVEEDEKRAFVQKNLNLAAHFFDEKTKLLYFDEEDPYDIASKKASLLYNFAYVFALCRSKNSDNILLAKELLTRLLGFQVSSCESSNGGFPKYIHAYPEVYDSRACTHIYVVLFKLFQLFHKVFEKPLKDALTRSLDQLKGYLKVAHKLYGTKEDLQPLVFAILGIEDPCEPFTISSKHLESLVYLNLYNKELASKYRKTLGSFFNKDLGSYAGPFFHEYFEKGKHRPTLFDLYMSSVENPQIDEDHPIHLLAALMIDVFPVDEFKLVPKQPLLYREMPVSVLQDTNSALTFFDSFEPKENDSYPKGFHTFAYLFGEKQKPASLVCQVKNMKIESTLSDDTLTLDFTYPEQELEDKKEVSELVFYLTRSEILELFVDHKKATIFKMNETLMIESLDRRIELNFEVVDGTGEFLGGISMGNRASQMHQMAIEGFQAFDWKIALRTLRRSCHLILRAKIKTILKQPLSTSLSFHQELESQ